MKVQEPYAILNARVGVSPADRRWAFEVFAQNLTDSEYYQVIIDQPLQAGTFGAYLGAPRTYGATARVRF